MNPAATPVHPLVFLSALCGLPLVLYALWADLKIQSLDEQRKAGAFREDSGSLDDEGPSTLQQQTFTAGVFSLVLILLELFLFLSARNIRDAHPVGSLLIFFGILFVQNRIQIRLLRALSPEAASTAEKPLTLPAESRPSLLRTFLWGGGMMAFAVGSVVGGGLLAVLLTRGFKPEVQAAALTTGALFGICGAIIGLYKLAPIYIRGLLGSKPLEDFPTIERLSKVFVEAGVRPPQFELLRNEDATQTNAFVAGGGVGRLGARLFLTPSILERFDEEEQKAIFLHEAAHLHLGHLGQRMKSTLLMILGLTLGGTALLVAAHWLLPAWAANFCQLLVPLAGLALPIHWTRTQIQRHELEADAHAVEAFGANPEALISALERLEKINSAQFPGLSTGTGTHPATRLRVLLIRKADRARKRKEARKRAENLPDTSQKAA
jgi:Zn-dependent protease with chaperone function